MTEIPDHLLARAQRAKERVHAKDVPDHQTNIAACSFNLESAVDDLEMAMASAPLHNRNLTRSIQNALRHAREAFGWILVEERKS